MAKTVGFNVVLGADTSAFTKALKKVDSSIRSTSNTLKNLSALTKLDPSNTQAFTLKQAELNKKFEETKGKLESLKASKAEWDKKLESGDLKVSEWANYEKQLAETEKEYKALKKATEEYSPTLDQVGTKVKATGDKFKEFSEKTSKISEGFKSVGSTLTKNVTAPIVAVATGSVKLSADFEQSMANVSATMGTTSTSTSKLNGKLVNTQDALTELARKMGKETVFSATEASEAINDLAMAGFDTQQIYDALPTVLNLASAGDMDLANSASMTANSMSALGVESSNVTTLADQMAKAATLANTDVSSMGEAFVTVGGMGKDLAGGTAELATALDLLASAGYTGSEAGTHLKGILKSLKAPTTEASGVLEDLGVSAYDSEGNFRPLNDTLSDLNKAMEGMTSEEKNGIISKLFNSGDLAQATALLGSAGDAWTDLQNKITDSTGSAEEMAKKKSETFQGHLKSLTSKIESVGITIGNKVMPYIEQLVDKIGDAFDAFSNLDPGVQDAIIKIAGIVALIGPLISVVGGLAGAITNISSVLGTLFGFIGSTVIPAIGAINAPVVAVIAVIGAVVGALVALYNSNEEFRTKVNDLVQNIADHVSEFAEKVKNLISAFVEWIKPFVEDFINFISPVVEVFIDGIVNFVKDCVDNISAFLDGLFTWINGILDVFTGLFSGNWELFWQGIKETMSGFLEMIKTIFKGTWDSITDILGTILGTIWEYIKQSFNRIKEFIKGILGWIKDFFINIFNSIKGFVSSIFQGIYNSIANKMTSAMNLIKGVIDSIKGFFNFSISWPHIPMPHFGISPRGWSVGDLLKGSIPRLSINWYAKAMDKPIVLDGAQIFGMMGNKLLGGGEAGREVVMSESQMEKLRGGKRINQTNNITIVQRDGESSKELARRVADILRRELDEDSEVFA